MAKKVKKIRRLFVLDTNVLLHDPYSTLKFKEHDVFIPFVTLEELDGKKSGQTDVNRNARQATRLLDQIVSVENASMETGYPLTGIQGSQALGRLFVQRMSLPFLDNEHVRKNDNLYLSVLSYLTTEGSHDEVILVTKDLNLRIKAKALGFKSDDFLSDHAVDDADLIYRGWREITEPVMTEWLRDAQSWKAAGISFYRIEKTDQKLNEFLLFPEGALFRVTEVDENSCVLQSVPDTGKPKNSVMGITSRNDEQRAALALLLDPEVDLVTLLGPAGTGKTLLALAAAMQQIEQGDYDTVLFTRANTPLGEDIGFLPGTEEEKMAPWLGALYDNVDVLAEAASSAIESQKVRTWTKDLIEIKAMTFMRGRTFHRKFVIVDEAQNLTPKQMKALVTRAGDGTKLVVLGNLAQIDSPYLSETSSGLAYLVERFKGWAHFGALVLDKGERSRLANAGNERL
jgi:PhoH-like ATPase